MLRAMFACKVATQCETCRFWEPADECDDVVVGECRLHTSETNRRHGDQPGLTMLAWIPQRRTTEGRDWCAEWRQ